MSGHSVCIAACAASGAAGVEARHPWAAVQGGVDLFVEAGERGGAGFRDRRVWGLAAGHRRPAALLDEGALLPGVHLLKFGQVRGSVGAVLKPVDADGRKCRYES